MKKLLSYNMTLDLIKVQFDKGSI